MELSTILEIVLGVVSIFGTIVGTIAWAMRWFAAFIQRLEAERNKAMDMMRQLSAEDSARCRTDSAAAAAKAEAHAIAMSERQEAMQRRMEGYTREDQAMILTVLDRNSDALASFSRAFERLTDHFSKQAPHPGAER